ncbi:hypothetical protein H0A64_07245 [Alcaligenaceae bacterium]|nr:hypothetical protein [Alcaligenaceae bacterium]
MMFVTCAGRGLYAMRELLEGAAAPFAATLASPMEVQSMQRMVKRMV